MMKNNECTIDISNYVNELRLMCLYVCDEVLADLVTDVFIHKVEDMLLEDLQGIYGSVLDPIWSIDSLVTKYAYILNQDLSVELIRLTLKTLPETIDIEAPYPRFNITYKRKKLCLKIAIR